MSNHDIIDRTKVDGELEAVMADFMNEKRRRCSRRCSIGIYHATVHVLRDNCRQVFFLIGVVITHQYTNRDRIYGKD